MSQLTRTRQATASSSQNRDGGVRPNEANGLSNRSAVANRGFKLGTADTSKENAEHEPYLKAAATEEEEVNSESSTEHGPADDSADHDANAIMEEVDSKSSTEHGPADDSADHDANAIMEEVDSESSTIESTDNEVEESPQARHDRLVAELATEYAFSQGALLATSLPEFRLAFNSVASALRSGGRDVSHVIPYNRILSLLSEARASNSVEVLFRIVLMVNDMLLDDSNMAMFKNLPVFALINDFLRTGLITPLLSALNSTVANLRSGHRGTNRSIGDLVDMDVSEDGRIIHSHSAQLLLEVLDESAEPENINIPIVRNRWILVRGQRYSVNERGTVTIGGVTYVVVKSSTGNHMAEATTKYVAVCVALIRMSP